MKLGGRPFLCKPVSVNQLISAIGLAVDKIGQAAPEAPETVVVASR
jgi:FixJ family two-component response regulator